MPVPESLSQVAAANVVRLLDERGMSGRGLSRATDLPQKSLSRKLAGDVPFGLDDLARIADVLDVHVLDLLLQVETPTEETSQK